MEESKQKKGDELVSSEAACEFLGISRTTLHRLITQNQLKGSKVGGQWRFRRADLEAYAGRTPSPVSSSALEAAGDSLREVCSLLGADANEAVREAGKAAPETYTGEHLFSALANGLIRVALRDAATEIHLEVHGDGLHVRQRLDGVLYPLLTMPAAINSGLVQRFKSLAAMDATDTLLPQDGRWLVTHDGHEYDLRLTTLPALYGESLTIQILPRSYQLVGLDELDLEDEARSELRQWVEAPYGLILFCGPRASGKTTTAYVCLQEANRPGAKVMTVEDPVELALPGVVQTGVQRRAGLTFATLLRAIRKHSPDVLFVGSLQETEAIEETVLAASTGNLVLAVSEADNAASAILQLRTEGTRAAVIGQCLVGAISQRLARRICPDCTAPDVPSQALLERLRPAAQAGGYTIPAEASWRRGQGCSKCRQTGYRGRVVLQERLGWQSDMTEALLREVNEHELTGLATANGMKTLLAEGVRQAVAGKTTLDEVVRVVSMPG